MLSLKREQKKIGTTRKPCLHQPAHPSHLGISFPRDGNRLYSLYTAWENLRFLEAKHRTSASPCPRIHQCLDRVPLIESAKQHLHFHQRLYCNLSSEGVPVGSHFSTWPGIQNMTHFALVHLLPYFPWGGTMFESAIS